jgi:hypothetical protein
MINSRRREERIAVKLPVRVWGMDANGKPFSLSTTTLDVTRNGARLSSLQCPLQQGDVIGIQHGTEKARFRVAWVGRPGTARQGQIGVLCAEADKYIWGTPLNQLKATAQPTVPPSPGPSFVQPLAPMIQAPAKPKASERREATRYACTGGAEFRNLEGGFKSWGTVSDVSDNGCYVETIFPLPATTQIELLVSVRNVDIRGRAQVRSSHPNVGMGIEFVQLSPEDRQRLESLISTLEIIPGAVQRLSTPPPEHRAPLGPVQAPSALSPRPIQREKPPNLSDDIYKVCAGLRDAEALLESSALQIEPRAINELKRSLDHANQTVESIQTWLENDGGQDRYKFIDEREAARVRTVTALARELAVDVDATSLNLGSDGFEGLLNAISQLHSRLAMLMQKGRGDQPDDPISSS